MERKCLTERNNLRFHLESKCPAQVWAHSRTSSWASDEDTHPRLQVQNTQLSAAAPLLSHPLSSWL